MSEKFSFNPITGLLDLVTSTHFGTAGLYFTDSNGVEWQVTVDTTGHLVTTQVVVASGGIIPLWFTLIPQ